MLQALVSTASRLLNDLNRSLFRRSLPPLEEPAPSPPPRDYQRLKRVVLTDQVCRTIFEEYAAHLVQVLLESLQQRRRVAIEQRNLGQRSVHSGEVRPD